MATNLPTGEHRKGDTINSGPFTKRTIAIVYDFDGTLAPGNMQDYGLLPKLGIKPEDFWSEVQRFKAENQSVMIQSYMHLLVQRMSSATITKDELASFGNKIPLFVGVESWFSEINAFVHKLSKGRISTKHYILSSGLHEILAGNLVSKHATQIFASSFIWQEGKPVAVARAITDASKPQYIFRINKGKESYSEDINEHMDEGLRPIPFSHIIFIGDRETDIPCMTVTRKNGGHAIAVYDPKKPENIANCKLMYDAKRVNFYAEADYKKDSALRARTEIILKKIVADIRLEWADHLFKTRVASPKVSKNI